MATAAASTLSYSLTLSSGCAPWPSRNSSIYIEKINIWASFARWINSVARPLPCSVASSFVSLPPSLLPGDNDQPLVFEHPRALVFLRSKHCWTSHANVKRSRSLITSRRNFNSGSPLFVPPFVSWNYDRRTVADHAAYVVFLFRLDLLFVSFSVLFRVFARIAMTMMMYSRCSRLC